MPFSENLSVRIQKFLIVLSALWVVPVAPAFSETLQAAVKRALTTNPAIKASSAEMKASAQELFQLREDFLPTVDLFGEAGYQHVDDPAYLPSSDNDRTQSRGLVALNAKLVLFDGYRRANRVYSRSARLDGNVFRLLDASETMALNATEAYIDVVRHRQLLGVAKRNVARHREIEARVRALVDGGRLPYSDLLTIEDRVDAANLTIIDIRRALRDADARYERVMGAKPGGGMHIHGVRTPASQSELVNNAVKNNYRIRHAQTNIEQARFNSQVVLSDNLPELSLNAGGGYGVNRNGLSGERSDAYVGFGFNWTLYQGGRSFERNALAERTYKAAFERDVAVREINELAMQSWNNFVAASERATQLSQQLEINRLIVKYYSDEFDAAKRTLLDLLEVERSRFNVEFQSVSADASRVFSTYRVHAAQSTLAEQFGIKPSDMSLEPTFRERARKSPRYIFDSTIEPLSPTEPLNAIEPLK